MSKRLDENLGSVGYDGLIVANEPVADVFTVTIRKEATAAATYKRGTVLALSAGTAGDGKLVILGSTDQRAPQGMAPIAIGLCLTLIHLISIPVTNTSVNPARSTGVALFVGDWAVGQLWLFWVAPIVGAILGALAYRVIATKE
jgi:hypothetical protein